RRRRAGVAAGNALSRRIEPDPRSRDRQRVAVHRPVAGRDRADGFKHPRGVSRHDTCRYGHSELGCGRVRTVRPPRDVVTITLLDWSVLVLYFVVILGIGLVVGSRVRRTGEYFLGGRRFGPWVMIAQSFSVGTHADMPVALAGAVYGIGA